MLLEKQDGTARVAVSESTSGVLLRNVQMTGIDSPVALTVSDDIDGNGEDEVAALGHIDASTSTRIDVRDAATKASVSMIDVP